MSAAGDRVCLYTADTAPLCDAALYAAAYGAVSPERRQKTEQLRFEKDKRLSLGAELLLMRACRDLGIRYAEQTVTEGGNKKPQFLSGCIEFNLSHSGDRVMCAVSDRPVGCDVEKIGQADTEIAKRFFHAEEYAALLAEKTDAARRTLFYRLWTLKESFLKCTGRGLYLPLDAFCVRLGTEGITAAQSLDGGQYRFAEHSPGDGYQYACCVHFPEDSCVFRDPEWKQAVFSEAFIKELREE